MVGPSPIRPLQALTSSARHARKRIALTTCRRSIVTAQDHVYPRKGDKVVVAMSGGVDSSVAAWLLAQQDFDLSAVFMRNWDTRDESGTDRGCEWERDLEDVRRVCRALGVRSRMVDLSKEYWTRVFEPALKMWETGQTPNPDVWCNKEVKFGALMPRLLGPDDSPVWLATGHYARRPLTPEPELHRGLDSAKDQSYYLSSIPRTSLARTLFPLGDLQKPYVRELARRANLPTAERAESMGICFVGEKRRFSEFVTQYVPPRPGNIVSWKGETVGTHNGLWTYTIGEGARLGGMKEKWFVARKDIAQNEIVVVPGPTHPLLYATRLVARDFAWIAGAAPPHDGAGGLRALVQIRHRAVAAPCVVRPYAAAPWAQDTSTGAGEDAGRVTIEFDAPQLAVAPGQVAAVYIGDRCMGCGTIEWAR